MTNLVKSLLGLGCYAPLVAVNMFGEILVRATEPAILWFERDESFIANDGVDGDTTSPDAWRGEFNLRESQ